MQLGVGGVVEVRGSNDSSVFIDAGSTRVMKGGGRDNSVIVANAGIRKVVEA